MRATTPQIIAIFSIGCPQTPNHRILAVWMPTRSDRHFRAAVDGLQTTPSSFG
eukprot:m.255939 g.255939  ORF g.255939 m.255939 type:complete len:53 (+) comp26568_c0_seq1:2008-2166(+)